MQELLVQPHGIIGAKNMPLVKDGNGGLARRLQVDLSTFPDAAIRDDAFQCGWLEISPYWEESYGLVVKKGILVYVPK